MKLSKVGAIVLILSTLTTLGVVADDTLPGFKLDKYQELSIVDSKTGRQVASFSKVHRAFQRGRFLFFSLGDPLPKKDPLGRSGEIYALIQYDLSTLTEVRRVDASMIFIVSISMDYYMYEAHGTIFCHRFPSGELVWNLSCSKFRGADPISTVFVERPSEYLYGGASVATSASAALVSIMDEEERYRYYQISFASPQWKYVSADPMPIRDVDSTLTAGDFQFLSGSWKPQKVALSALKKTDLAQKDYWGNSLSTIVGKSFDLNMVTQLIDAPDYTEIKNVK